MTTPDEPQWKRVTTGNLQRGDVIVYPYGAMSTVLGVTKAGLFKYSLLLRTERPDGRVPIEVWENEVSRFNVWWVRKN